ncbi:Uncharacterized protein Rs2_10568 [Raphanus sativus]|nr:Uncharacterized protein Rs2_10568 [Raphanus sativus]
MAKMMTTSPSCLRPPPDPPPPLFLCLMQPCSSSVKMLVTALPLPSQPRPPPDPPRPSTFRLKLPPVKPPEPPDPPDASVSLVLLRIFVNFSSSSPQVTQILDYMFNLSRDSSKLSDGAVALVFTGDIIFVYWRSFPVVYRLYQAFFSCGIQVASLSAREWSSHRSYSSLPFIHPLIDVQVHLSSLLSGHPYSFEWDAMLDVLVIPALVGNVLMDSVSFGFIFVSPSGFYVVVIQLFTAVCSPIIVFNLVCGAAYVSFSFWWQLKEKIIGMCYLVNMVMAGIDCPLGSCLEQSLFPIILHLWSGWDEHVWLVLQGFSSRLTLFPAFSAVVVTLRVTRDAIFQETYETAVMRFLICFVLYLALVALLYSPFMEVKLF